MEAEFDLFLRTKVTVPRLPRAAIERVRLESARTAVSSARLATIIAPGGFGKSTLAVEWVKRWHAEGHLCAWFSIDSDDDEPARFLYGLTQALSEFGPSVGQSAQALLRGGMLGAPRTVVSLLLKDLELLDGEVFVVLDDYQWLRDAEIHNAVAFLVSHAPDRFHLIITSRSTPPLPLSRARASGDWISIEAPALRFDAEETSRFLKAACPQPPTVTEVRELQSMTEGWAAALRIATLQPGNTALKKGLSSASNDLAHLIDSLLDNLPPAVVQFMAETAILDRLNPRLCDAVTGREDSTALLGEVVRRNLLVESAGDEGWLRYHQLLREYLMDHVGLRLAVDLDVLHRRAAQWFAEQSAWTDAVRHSLAAGDTARAIECLARCGMAVVKAGSLMTIVGWRRRFPPELLRGEPRVQLAIAWGLTLAMRHDDAEPLRQEIEMAGAAADASAAQRAAASDCLAIRAIALGLRDDAPGAREMAEAWNASEGGKEAWTANVVSNLMRFVCWKSGDLVGVYEQPWEFYSLDEDRQNVFSTVYREVILGFVELDQARLGLAERHAREAMNLAETHVGAQSVSSALAAPLLAALRYEQNRWDEAQGILNPLLPLIDATAMLECVMEAYLTLARIARAEGKSDLAYRLIEQAEAIGFNRGWDRLVGVMLLERQKWLVADDRIEEAKATNVRLTRIASRTTPKPVSAELQVYQDWGVALTSQAEQRFDEARERFSRLLSEARSARKELRVIQLGASLVNAHMSAGDRDAAYTVLRDVLLETQRSGAVRSLLDHAGDLRTLLPRFTVSPYCDPALAELIRQRLGDEIRKFSADDGGALVASVTTTERRVLSLVAQGKSNKEVARALNVSAETVKTHLKSAFAKLGVQGRAQATEMARTLGLLQ